MDHEKTGRLSGVLNRYKYVLVVGLLGVLLMAWPTGDKAPPQIAEEPSLREMEGKLRDILGKMQGVGRVDVMLTVHSGPASVLASDTSLQYRGSVQAPEEYQRSTRTVTIPGSEGVVVTERRLPQFRGALVVCDGGREDSVRLRIVEAVGAVTGLGADRIAVVPWEKDRAVSSTIGG